MNREVLVALRAAIDTVLTWPDDVRAEMARWLTPEAAKPNGRENLPPLTLNGGGRASDSRLSGSPRGEGPSAANPGACRPVGRPTSPRAAPV
jgi:hypothetical protein